MGTVGRNAEGAGVGGRCVDSSGPGGLERVGRKASTAKRAIATAAIAHLDRPPRLRCGRKERLVVADRFMIACVKCLDEKDGRISFL